ncbi:MAG TPA: 16S rRNA (adenine(1518)-N(6)/adenine(1519)-N(6))-dimethyltransferase RsmA [Polyangiaceae bacterium]
MTDARSVLRDHRLAPKKSFGQNFLVDANVANAIAEACVHGDEPNATVVELGAGLGALTTLLAPRAKRLVAVERDRDLVPILRETMAPHAHVEVVEGDAQGIDIDALFADASSPRVLCGNLPYQITGRLIGAAIEHALAFDRAVFMVQKEVADRLRAAPSTKDYGALTVFAQAAFDVTTARVVSPGCFFPPPDVTSAVVVMSTRRPPRAEETETFRALVKGAFAQRRKTLRNAWKSVGLDRVAPAAEKAGVSLDLRGETLDVEAFAKVARFVDEG